MNLGGSGDVPLGDPHIVTLGFPVGVQASDPTNPVQLLVRAGTWQRTFARGDCELASSLRDQSTS